MKMIKYLPFLLLLTFLGSLVLFSNCNYTPKVYFIFDSNGAEGTEVGTIIKEYTSEAGTMITLPSPGNLTKTNCFFNGWFMGTYSNKSWMEGETYTAHRDGSVTFYADWRFYLTYDGNGNTGGTVPIDDVPHMGGSQVYENFPYALNTGDLVKTGYTFAGWNTKADGTGDNYRPGEYSYYLIPTSFTLYAKWVSNGFSVTYDGNGSTSGTVPIDNSTYQQSESVSVKSNSGNLLRTGFAFNGWNTEANGGGTHYAADGTATFAIGEANVTLYAEWVPTYTVTYDGNGNTGGTVPVDNGTYQQGASVTVKANSGNLVRTGFTFNGWNTKADGTGISYAANATFTMGTANVILFAKWQPVASTYTVTYDGNGNDGGGTVPVDNTNYADNATVTVLGNTGGLARIGFTFGGWSDVFSPVGPPAGGTVYQAGETFTINSNVTLFAVWLIGGGGGGGGGGGNCGPGAYQVIYNGNGSDGGAIPTDNNCYMEGVQVSVYGNQIGQLTRTGFTFNGWNTKADGTGIHYEGDGSAFLTMGTSTITLYAEWQ